MARDEIAILQALVEAHETPHPKTGAREPVMFLKMLGGHHIQHHALDSDAVEDLDEALVEDFHSKGLVDVDYREHNLNIRTTSLAASMVDEHERVTDDSPTADLDPIFAAIREQAAVENPLGWPAVRSTLLALRGYWQDSGYPEHGIRLGPILTGIPEHDVGLFRATVRALRTGDYLDSASQLQVGGLPGEMTLTARAHAVVDGWPGASGTELAENLLAVLVDAADEENDPAEQKRLRKLADTVREVGVATAGDILARAITGGA